MENSRGAKWPICEALIKKPLVGKHHKRYCKFYKNLKKSFWWDRNGRWALVSIFLSMLQSVCTVASRSHSEDPTGDRNEINNNHSSLYSTEAHRSWCSAKKVPMWSVVFSQLHFSGFPNGKAEFSSSHPTLDFLSAHGQFNMSHQIRSGVENREASLFKIAPPTLFARHKAVQFLAL